MRCIGEQMHFVLLLIEFFSFQTIQEQQKVIRRLLKKTNSNNSSDSLKHFSLNGNSEEYNDLTGETITFFLENFLKTF